VLAGEGKAFCAGIDLASLSGELFGAMQRGPDPARSAHALRRLVASYQASFTAIEKATQPVIAAVHGSCIGAGVDMIAACDMRYCTADAAFQIKEVDVGLAADVGTLQRLPKIVGNQNLVRELAYTARALPADEALQLGLVGSVHSTLEDLHSKVLALASSIASKSPVAVMGTKVRPSARRRRASFYAAQTRLIN
jgi:enoyl-CoA hydratase/carnithine racemase